MLTLTEMAAGNNEFMGDVLDKRPSKVPGFDPKMFVLKDSMTLKQRVETLITSDVASQKCWAISKIPKLATQGQDVTDLVMQIPTFINSLSTKIEMHAASAAYELIKMSPGNYEPVFFQPILKRILIVPAVEYVNCIACLAKVIGRQKFSQNTIPLIQKLLTLGDAYQRAACSIILSVPTTILEITPEMFGEFLNSTILVNEYIMALANYYSSTFGSEWISKTLPSQLLEILEKDSSKRAGVAQYYISFQELIHLPNTYQKVSSIFEWGTQEESVAFIILQHTEEIISSHFVDFNNKPLVLLHGMLNSPNVETRMKIGIIMNEHPILIKNKLNEFRHIITSMSQDRSPKVRQALINTLPDLLNTLGNSKERDILIATYVSMFNDSDKTVREALVNPVLLLATANSKPANFATLYIRLFGLFTQRWRYASKFISTAEEMPIATLDHSLRDLLSRVDSSAQYNPQALSKYVISFYKYLLTIQLNSYRQKDVFRHLGHKYAISKDYHMRILYYRVLTEAMTVVHSSEFMEHAWHVITILEPEKVSFVQIAIMEFILKFSEFFQTSKMATIASQMQKIVAPFVVSKDPQVKEAYQKVFRLFPATRSRSTGNFSDLPALSKQSPSPGPSNLSPRRSMRGLISRPDTPKTGTGRLRVSVRGSLIPKPK